MKIFAPTYYKKFKCIADQCRHSCCIDWEIDVDERAYQKYSSLPTGEREAILSTVEITDGKKAFRLTEDLRCPHLNCNGLCEMIIRYGDDMLTDICREHPRFYNTLKEGVEAGLGLVCEEAARLIVTNDEPFHLQEIGETEDTDVIAEFSPRADRDAIIQALEREDISYAEKLSLLEAKYTVSASLLSEEEWIDIIGGLEILDPEWERLISLAREREPQPHGLSEKYFEKLLVYFVYRHVSAACDYDKLRAALGFSMMSVKVIEYLLSRSEEPSLMRLIEIARQYSSEIEYSEENTAELIFEFECLI